MKTKKPVIFLVGPTAVGKSRAATEIAVRLGTEIISADSRQVYRGMDIGTDKPTPAERGRARHHMIDVVEPDEGFSAGRFREMSGAVIDRLHREGRVPLVVGGTGLYVKLLAYGLWEGPGADWDLRERLRREESARGPGHLHQRLRAVDPETAERIHPNDLSKTVRALEVQERTGRPLSDFHRGHQFGERPYEAVLIGLRREREDLYRRIEERVDAMVRNGLTDEVGGLLKKGYSPELSSMRGLGYRQMIGYCRGRSGLAEAVLRLKRDTRRYAKRQFTWFNRDASIRWIDLAPSDGTDETAEKIFSVLQRQEDGVYAGG
jgi:tRNA dimethylallyltransferase